MVSRTGWTLSLSAAALLVAGSLQAQSYPDPAGGWLHAYEADPGQDAAGSGADDAFDALDGTFSHDNGSDAWDGSAIGAGSPGGANIVDGALRIQDAGNPTNHDMPDPSNRKLYLGHDLSADGASATLLDDGVTLYVRARVPTPNGLDDIYPNGGGEVTPYPAGGDGYPIHDGGKGNISLKQASGGVISFSLDPEAGGLQTNNLNGTAVSGTVDTGEAGTANVLATDVTAYHEYWITISGGGSGTHQVTIYMDGATTASAVFDVTAGSGSDFSDISYVALGAGSTGASGAIDIDYARVAAGVQSPGPAVEVPSLSTVGLVLMSLALLAAGAFVLRGGRRPALAVR